MWKEICTYALKHQESFFRKSQDEKINYKDYDADILKICGNDFQFANYLIDKQADKFSDFKTREANIYSTLFFQQKQSAGVKVLQSLATDYVERYLNDGISFAQSRKALFEGLGNYDNIKVSIQDILAKPTPDIINETTVETLINRFRRIYLMRRLLFFSYLQTSMAIVENDKNNQKDNTKNFYNKFSAHIANDQDYLFLHLTDEKPKAPQTTADEHAGIEAYSDINDVVELKQMLESIHKSLSEGGEAPKDIKGKVEELSKKTEALKGKYTKESLSEKWKTGSFASNKGAAKKALNENASEVAKTLSNEIGQGFTNLLAGKKPSLEDGDFWKHVGRSVGPMILGTIGTAIGGPIVGSLFGGIGKSLFGAILGDEPDPLSQKLDEEFDDLKKRLDEKFSVVDGKLDDISTNLNKLFTETQDKFQKTNDYIENLFKDLGAFHPYFNNIKDEEMEMRKEINIIKRYYNEILFSTKEDDKQPQIRQIESEAKNLLGLEEKMLTRLENIVKKLYSSEYNLSVNKINIPNSIGNDSIIKEVIDAHASDKDRRRFDDTMDYLINPLNVIESIYRIYYQNRKFLFASQAVLFVFHRNKIDYADVLPSLKAMYNAQDSINAALLLHPYLLKANSIGQRNLEFYSLVKACKGKPNGLQSFGFMIDPKDPHDYNNCFFLRKGKDSLQFGYGTSGNYISIIPDSLSADSPFNLKFWEFSRSLGEAKIHICLGQDDTLTLFDGNKKIGESMYYVSRLNIGVEWIRIFPKGNSTYVRQFFNAAWDKTTLEFDFSHLGQYPYIEIVITKINDFKDKIEISSIVSLDDHLAKPPKKKLIKSLEANYQEVYEKKEELTSKNTRVNFDMRYQPGEETITLWYSFPMSNAADVPIDNKDNKIEVNNLLEGFPYYGF